MRASLPASAPVGLVAVFVIGWQMDSASADESPKTPAELILVIEINAKGEVVVKGREPLSKPEEIKKYLAEECRRLKRHAEEKKLEFKPEAVIWGHREAAFERVYGVMKQAKEVGFDRTSLRTKRPDK